MLICPSPPTLVADARRTSLHGELKYSTAHNTLLYHFRPWIAQADQTRTPDQDPKTSVSEVGYRLMDR
jgi:hypothetical protein